MFATERLLSPQIGTVVPFADIQREVAKAPMGSVGVPAGPPFEIPDFNHEGILPPFFGPTPTNPALMSPYLTTMRRVAEKLCRTSERNEIFKGLLKYRQMVSGLGLHRGIQWLSGSFMEDIETLEQRPPRDIDVVTFCHRPPTAKSDEQFGLFARGNLGTLDPRNTKSLYKCDAYLVDLDSDPANVVNQTRYWFGLFSHRRTGIWKGILEVSLMVGQDDADASSVVGA